MSLVYAQEKAYKMLDSLGANEGTLTERLMSATIPSLMSLVDECERRTSGLHVTLEAEIVALFTDHLNSAPAVGDEGTIQATLNALGELERVQVAERPVSLCIEVMQQQGDDAFMLGRGRGEDADLLS
jgi:hypothetical protein